MGGVAVQLSGLKLAGMFMVFKDFPDVSKTKTTRLRSSDCTWGSPFLAFSSRNFTKLPVKTTGESHANA